MIRFTLFATAIGFAGCAQPVEPPAEAVPALIEALRRGSAGAVLWIEPDPAVTSDSLARVNGWLVALLDDSLPAHAPAGTGRRRD